VTGALERRLRGKDDEHDYFRQLAQYNAWTNWRLYDACARLDDGERRKPRPCFFGSILATLNHILVADRIWLARLTCAEHGIANLDQQLYADSEELRARRGHRGRAPDLPRGQL
jgi:uncharacterized damage-inducible protein DinB